MKIISINVGKRDKEKLVIKTECGKYIFANIDDAYALKVGEEISDEQAEFFSCRYKKTLAKKSAAGTLARRSVSKNELLKKLIMKGFSEEDALEAVDWFSQRGFVDDETYSRAVSDYYKKRGYGSIRIKQELMRRGISKELSENALFNMGSYESELSMLVQKKLGGDTPTKEKIKKTIAFLIRRGFKYDEIRRAIENADINMEDID